MSAADAAGSDDGESNGHGEELRIVDFEMRIERTADLILCTISQFAIRISQCAIRNPQSDLLRVYSRESPPEGSGGAESDIQEYKTRGQGEDIAAGGTVEGSAGAHRQGV
ncbi:MAG: hypothetical protein QM770_23150 [Tepidisphaeraceae bacterium]